MLTFGNVAVDGNEHHIRIVSDGTGLIDVCFDAMVPPVISYGDGVNFIGGANQYMAFYDCGSVSHWVDNVTATTP